MNQVQNATVAPRLIGIGTLCIFVAQNVTSVPRVSRPSWAFGIAAYAASSSYPPLFVVFVVRVSIVRVFVLHILAVVYFVRFFANHTLRQLFNIGTSERIINHFFGQ